MRGFTNRDIRSQLTKTRCLRSCVDDPKKARARAGRCFRRPHAHGLIAKIPRTRRWCVTACGRQAKGTSPYKGRAFYGQPAPLSLGQTGASQDQCHVGQGRLLPSTSVDQFAATLARWCGASAVAQHLVLPNLRHFGDRGGGPDYPTDLGFMYG